LNFPGLRLFRRLKRLQQLADIRRVQGINALAIDALIFAASAPLLKQEAQRLLALRTYWQLGHWRSGIEDLWVHRESRHALKVTPCKATKLLILLDYYTHFEVFGQRPEPTLTARVE
jgi:hypothetical protein